MIKRDKDGTHMGSVTIKIVGNVASSDKNELIRVRSSQFDIPSLEGLILTEWALKSISLLVRSSHSKRRNFGYNGGFSDT